MTIELNPAGDKPRVEYSDDLVIAVGSEADGWSGMTLGVLKAAILADVAPGPTPTPTPTTGDFYFAVGSDGQTDFDATDLANGVAFSRDLIVANYVGNRRIALFRRTQDGDFSQVTIDGFPQIQGFTKQAATIMFGNTEYSVWVSNQAVNISGSSLSAS